MGSFYQTIKPLPTGLRDVCERGGGKTARAREERADARCLTETDSETSTAPNQTEPSTVKGKWT